MDNEKIFEKWKEICNQNEEGLRFVYNSNSDLTDFVFKENDGLVYKLAKSLNPDLRCIVDYYNFDAIFAKEELKVPSCPSNRTWTTTEGAWFTRIEVLFEHENNYKTAYQEICHFLQSQAECKVLVTYVYNEEQNDNRLKVAQDFHSLVKQSGTKEKILVIFGYHDTETNNVYWEGYELDSDKDQPYKI